VRRAFFLDTDEQHGAAVGLAADRLQARLQHARDFFQAVLDIAFRGWERIAALEVEGLADPRQGKLMEAVILDRPDSGHTESGRLRPQGRRAKTHPDGLHQSVTHRPGLGGTGGVSARLFLGDIADDRQQDFLVVVGLPHHEEPQADKQQRNQR
jgi:hypothetical protein